MRFLSGKYEGANQNRAWITNIHETEKKLAKGQQAYAKMTIGSKDDFVKIPLNFLLVFFF